MRTRLFYQGLTAMAVMFSLLASGQGVNTANPPKVPVGYDAYRMWDQWPTQRIGARAYMRSTYDRRGHNEGADASHFLFMKEEDFNVTLDVIGKGILYFFRTNHWHGSPWHFVVDGKDNIVKETGTADPINAKKEVKNAQFIPAKAFPEPLNWTWGTTKGADLIWSPIAFEDSFRLAYSRTRYGTGYYIYHQFADDDRLTQPISSWDINKAPDQDVLDLIAKSGTDVAPKNISRKSGKLTLNKDRVVVADIKGKPSAIRALKFSLPLDRAIDLERVRLKITWDGRKEASVDAPLCLFFGSGTFYNRDKKEYLVKGFPINARFDYEKNVVELGCYYPMPFFKSAKIELEGITPGADAVSYEVRYEPLKTVAAFSSYFHATYRDFPEPEPGKDLVLLDTKGEEGHEDWTGNFVGTSFIFSHEGNLRTLEADPRFFFDDSETPQAYGTGTEEWGGGGDYWGGENMTLPFAGHPVGVGRDVTQAKDPKDLIESAYRFLLADLMPFGKRAKIHLEHGGENLSTEHYETVTYWYGLPAATLIRTDDLDIGSKASEQAHNYHSPDASGVYELTSRYELGIDKIPMNAWRGDTSTVKDFSRIRGKEVYPAHTENGRYTKGVSEFTVKLDPKNMGALIRRTLDYSFPNQRAEVYISSDGSSNWQLAGTWYLAGSNTCVYSNPTGTDRATIHLHELDPRDPEVQTSNRRFRDDEFLIPAKFTANKSSVRVRIRAVPNEIELMPDHRFPRESAWSELGYKVYSYVTPEFKP